jgi:hypothetical protein
MKALVLAVAVAAGVVCSANTADAQYRSRGSYRYVVPTYVAPTYVAPAYTYAVPSSREVVTSSYTPIVTSSYTPVVTRSYTPDTVIYSGGSYYDPTVWGTRSYSTYPTYYSGSYYDPGVYVSPAGVTVGSRRIRW